LLAASSLSDDGADEVGDAEASSAPPAGMPATGGAISSPPATAANPVSLRQSFGLPIFAAACLALLAPASAQDSRLKAALTACMTQAVTHPLPQMLDVDNTAAVVYACEGQRSCCSLQWSWFQIRHSRAM
jgi:hypothetical protein